MRIAIFGGVSGGGKDSEFQAIFRCESSQYNCMMHSMGASGQATESKKELLLPSSMTDSMWSHQLIGAGPMKVHVTGGGKESSSNARVLNATA